MRKYSKYSNIREKTECTPHFNERKVSRKMHENFIKSNKLRKYHLEVSKCAEMQLEKAMESEIIMLRITHIYGK